MCLSALLLSLLLLRQLQRLLFLTQQLEAELALQPSPRQILKSLLLLPLQLPQLLLQLLQLWYDVRRHLHALLLLLLLLRVGSPCRRITAWLLRCHHWCIHRGVSCSCCCCCLLQPGGRRRR
jgi:hypothetical protein